MEPNINLKELERKAYRSFFQDGLFDIYLGLILIVGIVPTLLYDIISAKVLVYGAYFGALLLVFLIHRAFKKFITIPRIGRVKFGPARKAKQKKLIAIAIVSTIITASLVVLTIIVISNPKLLGPQLMGSTSLALFIGTFLIIIFSLFAYFRDFPRLYVHGILVAVGISSTILLDSPVTTLAAGGIILYIGMVILIRFLRAYPIPSPEDSDDNQ